VARFDGLQLPLFQRLLVSALLARGAGRAAALIVEAGDAQQPQPPQGLCAEVLRGQAAIQLQRLGALQLLRVEQGLDFGQQRRQRRARRELALGLAGQRQQYLTQGGVALSASWLIASSRPSSTSMRIGCGCPRSRASSSIRACAAIRAAVDSGCRAARQRCTTALMAHSAAATAPSRNSRV
jgi:hypothetical protein